MSYLYKQYLRLITRWPRDKYKSDSRNLCYFLEREVERVFNQSAEPPNPALCERRLKVANTSLQSSALSPRWFSLATTSRMTGAPLGNGSNGSGSGGGGIQHEYPKDAADAVREVLKNAATSDVCVIESTAATQSHPKIKDILFPACVKLDVKVASALVSPSYIPHLLETIGRNELPLFFIRGNLVGGVNELQKLADRGTLEESVKKHDYDLVVIGGGSGGLAAAKEAAQLGKKVACLDFVKPTPIGTTWGLGGTCVNVGCIPKKLMHQAALLGEAIHDAKKFGWKIPEGQITHSWTKLVEGVQDHIGGLNWGYRVQLREKKVDYKNAYGVFTGSHEITATTKRGKAEKLTADKFLVAVGLRPRYPDVPGAKECTITSDDLFALPYNPGKTLCIGASYVSLECAGFLRGLGNEVSVLVRSILLRGFDQDMAERIRKVMIEKGVHFENGVPVKFERLAEPTSKAPGRVRVHYKRIGEDKKVEELTEEYDTIIVAIGRDAQTSDLGLEKVGVEVDSSGKVKGDLEQSKSVPHVYAIGDVLSGSPELTPVAIQAGRILMRRIFTGAPEFTEYDKIPTTVFTPLEYGCCGLSEDQAIERYGKDEVVVYHNVFEPLEYSVPDRMEKKHCYLKLVTLAKDERVLGFHILSPNAGEITQGFAIALKFEAKKADFDRLIGIHPTVAEQFTTLNIVKKENQELKSSGC